LSNELASDLKTFFTEDAIEKIAKETEFVKRESGKINGVTFLNTILTANFDNNSLSLNDLSSDFANYYSIKIRKQSIDERFSKQSVEFLKKLVEDRLKEILKKNMSAFTFSDNFKSIRIKDSTSFQLPENMTNKYPGSGGSASSSQIRIQFEYDLKTGYIFELSLSGFNKNDQTNAVNTLSTVEEGDLLIRDLGYVSISVMISINEKNAFFLNRLNTTTEAYFNFDDNNPINFINIAAELKKKQLQRIEKHVFIGKNKQLKVRMIVERLSDETIEARLRKANKEAEKKGAVMSKEKKARMSLNIYITNISEDLLPVEKIRFLYSMRWQIELIFKVWKSIGKIHEIKKMKVERFETMLYAKLLWLILNWSVFWRIAKDIWLKNGIILSMYKTYKSLRNMLPDFRFVLLKKTTMVQYINQIITIAPDNMQFEKKKDSLALYEIIIILCYS